MEQMRRATLTLLALLLAGIFLVALSETAETAPAEGSAEPAKGSAIVDGFFQVLEAIERAGNVGYVLLLCFFFVVVCLSLPTTPIELSAGFLYGPVWGCTAGVIGKTVGCFIAYMIARVLGNKRGWKVPAALEPRLSALKSQPLLTMVGIRVAPLPLGLKNYGLAMCKVPAVEYVLASLIVNIPFSCLWGSLGASCKSLKDALNFDTSKVSIVGSIPGGSKPLVAIAVPIVGFVISRLLAKKPADKKSDGKHEDKSTSKTGDSKAKASAKSGSTARKRASSPVPVAKAAD